MFFDRRFPNLVRIEDAPPSTPARGRMLWFARRAASRSFLSVCFNTATGGLFFYMGDEVDRGVYEYPWAGQLETGEIGTDVELDHLVRFLGQRNLSRREKDRIAEQNKTTQDNDARERRGREFENGWKETENYARFLSKRRRGVQTVTSV